MCDAGGAGGEFSYFILLDTEEEVGDMFWDGCGMEEGLWMGANV